MKTVFPFACCVLLCAGAATAQVVEIPAMTLPSITIDMDNVGPAGPTNLGAINAAGQPAPSGITGLNLTPSGAALGVYDTNTGQGRALAIDGSGNLLLVDPGGSFTAFNASIDLAGCVDTEFGCSIGDWAGSVIFTCYLGGSPVGSVTISYSGGGLRYLQSTSPFDRVDIAVSTGGNWVIADIVTEICGPPPPTEYQTNSSAMAVDIDGVNGNQFFPTILKKGTSCAPLMPQSGTLNIASTEVGAPYDVVISTSPIVPASSSITIGGEIVNVNVFQPFVWLSTGTATGGTTLLPSWFPGATSSEIHIGFSIPGQTILSVQGVVISGALPGGFKLSQATQLEVNLQPPPTSISGPTTVTGLTTVDVTASPTCWIPGGIPFYGSTFSSMTVFAGGTIQFGGTDTDTSPSVLDAMNDDGRVGFWTSMDPSEGGNITISNPAPNILRADWNGVFYDAGGPGNTFGIQIDCGTGVIQIDGLAGLMPNPNTTSTTDDQWLGISPGITFPGTTNPGATPFAMGMFGGAVLPTDMLYEFNDVSVSLAGLPASVMGGMTSLVFTPDGGGNYTWVGM